MASSPHRCFNATDRSYFALMKKEIHTLATANGFSEQRVGEIDIVVAEMASNLIKHGGGGEILVKMVNMCGEDALEIICIDNGPGMQDMQKMISDGYSSTNTLGHGLGSINRLSDMFQVYSLKDWGTILLARIFRHGGKKQKLKPIAEVRELLICKPGEEVCGDGSHVICTSSQLKLLLGDGLGHGPEANKAVNEAIKSFEANAGDDPVALVRDMNVHVKRTRGLVASIAVYSIKGKRWTICGVGNISTRMYNPTATKNYMAYNGIVGLNVPNTMKTQEIPGDSGQVLIMCSDGIKTKWDMSKYTGIMKYDLSILAAAIYKDHARRTDDMSVLVCRLNRNI